MRALVFAVAVALAGCGGVAQTFDLSAPDGGTAVDGIAFERCESWCVRPSDCAIGFPSDEICPGGFLCSSKFSCSSDGGTRD